VRLLCATRQLDGPGGAETYLVTLADNLRRLGHDPTFTATQVGPPAGGARAAGFAVASADEQLDPPPDAIVVQDRALSLRFAQRYPETPQVFVVHGVDHDYEMPQPGVDVVSACVVLNDRQGKRAEALAGGPPVVRLRQPVDMRRFKPHGPPRDKPRRALVLSNNFPPERLELLRRAWEPRGVEVTPLGRNPALAFEGKAVEDPRAEISAADIVVGYGRAMLEAMASGRLAFVYAGPGGDGWVTADKYPAMESDGFAGGAFGEVYDEQRLRAALDDYDPALGLVGRDLVRFPHDAGEHAALIDRLLREATSPGVARPDALPQLERMVDLLWQAEGRAATLRVEVGALYRQLGEYERLLEERRAEIDRLTATKAELIASRRYKLGSRLARPLDAVKKARRGG
jgi:hypothetical protein